MKFYKTLCQICAFFFLFGFVSVNVQAQNTPELWNEFLHLQENNFPELSSAKAHARFYGVVKSEEVEGTMRGRINVFLDILKKRIQERFVVSLSGKNMTTDEEVDISADVEIRIFPEDIYLALHDFDFSLEGDPEADVIQASVLPYLQKWIQISLDDLGADAGAFSMWQESMENATYEDAKAQVLQGEYLSETEVSALQKFFESLEQGKIFTLSKKEISEERVVYIMRLNKRGILNFIEDVAEIMGAGLTEFELQEIESFLKKISFLISVAINPEDPSMTRGRVSFRGMHLFPEVSLISFKMFASEHFNTPVNITEPKDATPFEEILLASDPFQNTYLPEEIEEEDSGALGILDSDHIMGPKDAEIVLIEYADLECPFCGTFHSTIREIIDSNDGNVSWVYRHFPLSFHAGAHTKAEASECVAKISGEESFWDFIDLLYEDQSIGFSTEELSPLVEMLGIETSVFEDCLDSGEMDEVVESHIERGIADEVSGTPSSTLVNTQTGETHHIPGAMPKENVQNAVDNLLLE